MATGFDRLLAPFESISFRQSLAIGAGGGLLLLGMVWALGSPAHHAPSAPHSRASDPGVDARPDGTVESAPAESAAAPSMAADGGATTHDTAGAGGRAANPHDAEGPGLATTGGPVDADSPGDASTTTNDGSATDGGPSDASTTTAAGSTAAASDTGEPDDLSPAGEDDSGPPPLPTARDVDADAERAMNADELRAAAKEALDQRRYRDAFRLATRSQSKSRSNATLLIKGLAACGFKDEDAARAVVHALPPRDERRKTIRKSCRDRGARIGI